MLVVHWEEKNTRQKHMEHELDTDETVFMGRGGGVCV